jgi:hypothetical protein
MASIENSSDEDHASRAPEARQAVQEWNILPHVEQAYESSHSLVATNLFPVQSNR